MRLTTHREREEKDSPSLKRSFVRITSLNEELSTMHLYHKGELISNQELLSWRWGASKSFTFQSKPPLPGGDSAVTQIAKLAKRSMSGHLGRSLETISLRQRRRPTAEGYQDLERSPRHSNSPSPVNLTPRKQDCEPPVSALPSFADGLLTDTLRE